MPNFRKQVLICYELATAVYRLLPGARHRRVHRQVIVHPCLFLPMRTATRHTITVPLTSIVVHTSYERGVSKEREIVV